MHSMLETSGIDYFTLQYSFKILRYNLHTIKHINQSWVTFSLCLQMYNGNPYQNIEHSNTPEDDLVPPPR